MKVLHMRFPSTRAAASFVAVISLFGALSATASAQQVQAGVTSPVLNLFVRGVDTAGDPSGNYLVVGGQGTLYAMCINAQGAPITGPMPINATGGYSSFPRAVYSPYINNGGGGFMIAWAEAPNDPGGNVMRALFTRWVTCSGVVGPYQVVSLRSVVGAREHRHRSLAGEPELPRGMADPSSYRFSKSARYGGCPVGSSSGAVNRHGPGPERDVEFKQQRIRRLVQRRNILRVRHGSRQQRGGVRPQYVQCIQRHPDDHDRRIVQPVHGVVRHVVVRNSGREAPPSRELPSSMRHATSSRWVQRPRGWGRMTVFRWP